MPDYRRLANIGTTVNVCYLDGSSGKVTIANLGDSRTMGCRFDGIKPLSFDHKPEDIAEKQRIQANGYYVLDANSVPRIYKWDRTEQRPIGGGLNISRTIGDFFYKENYGRDTPAISNEPDVIDTNFLDFDNSRYGDPEFILIACDGIWEGADACKKIKTQMEYGG